MLSDSCTRRSSFCSTRFCGIFGLFVALLLTMFPAIGFGLGQPRYTQGTASAGSFELVGTNSQKGGGAARLWVDSADFPGVLRAAKDLQGDIFNVTGVQPEFAGSGKLSANNVVLIGTLGKSRILDQLVGSHKIDVSSIQGKWEATLTQVVDHPLPGIARALVIAGSDKRGTIYGIYDLSEQIGVSPWYWWADVPVKKQAALYIQAGRWVQGEPAVKYRGIFLNDEAPALSGWANEKFGGLNHQFYEHVFELLLRLKANYLWPAMWNNAFNEDDPMNPKLADEYGIVMGTSHHEPMLRAQQEWKRHGSGPWDYATNSKTLQAFWEEGIERNKNYESAITLGMRGDGDMPMAESDNIALLEKIVADQRQIISRHRTPTIDSDPKVWALYKEVQGYYEKGMRVPDDITLLWSDDNWGNLRRLPTAEERKRSGGAGIYYHFDYVGDPRNYKWLNANSIPRVWEQMNLARAYGADRIWIVNVGDLKPMEFPIEFFLDLARTPDRWDKDHLQEFGELWAAREFGPEHAVEIADLIAKYTQYNSRRKPELLEPNTFSLVNYGEADRVLSEWQALTDRAEKLYRQIPAEQRDAYFELVLHPVKASAIVNQLHIAAGKNRLYAAQGRASASDFAEQARALFAADAALENEYNHTLLNGKWNHMMDQTHIGYTYWQEPRVNVMPAVSEVRPLHQAYMQVAIEGSAETNESWAARMTLPDFDVFNQQSRFVDVFNSGDQPFEFTATGDKPWILIDGKTGVHTGSVTKDTRLQIRIDWENAPHGLTAGAVTINAGHGRSARVKLRAFRPEGLTRNAVDGFVEANHVVSMEAEHFTAKSDAGAVHWDRVPGLGEMLSGMTVFPVTAASAASSDPEPVLEYRMYLFEGGAFDVQAIIAPTLNFVPGRGLRYALSFDDQPPQIIDALANSNQKDWEKVVSDGVRKVSSTLHVDGPGYHTLKFRMVDPGVVLEKLVVSQGDPAPSYLGPPESFRGSVSARY